MIAGILLLLSTALLGSAGAVHPDSLSSSRIRVAGTEAHLTLRCQILSLLEVIPGLDANSDGEVTGAEVEAQHGAIAAYTGEHYRLFVGTNRDLEGGSRLRPGPCSVQHFPAGSDDGIGFREGAVEVACTYRAPDPILDLMVECDLFFVTSPAHIDLATIEWAKGSESFALNSSTPRGRSDPQGRGAFPVFLHLGWGHILSGWDHLSFLLALILSARRLRTLVGLVTAFTLAHSLTLALVSLDIIQVSGFSNLIELTIALSIAYVAADHLLRPQLIRSRWIEAFVFGLVHGLGFAGFLQASLVGEKATGTALLAFNLGVELAQVAVVCAIALALAVLPAKRSASDPFLAPRLLRRAGSAAVVLLGLYWFAQRLE
jgi:HupE / UreJ protein